MIYHQMKNNRLVLLVVLLVLVFYNLNKIGQLEIGGSGRQAINWDTLRTSLNIEGFASIFTITSSPENALQVF